MPAGREGEARDVKAQIAALDKQRPRPLPTALAIGERGRVPQPTFFLHRGSPDSPGSQMTPGVLSVVERDGVDVPGAAAPTRSRAGAGAASPSG